MSGNLHGRRIAFLAADGVERDELIQPWGELQGAGAEVELISLKKGTIQAMEHDEKSNTFTVDKAVAEVTAAEYDGLVLPGGVANPDHLRTEPKAVEFVKDFFAQGKPVAAICHGPWMLVEANVLHGRTVTSWPSLRTDIINAGGSWVDEEVHVDEGLVTSRKPEDLDSFCAKAIEEFAEGSHSAQHA